MAAPQGRLGVRFCAPGAPACPMTVPDWPEQGRVWIPGELVPLEELAIDETAVRAWIEEHTPKPFVEIIDDAPTGRVWDVDDVCPIELVERPAPRAARTKPKAGQADQASGDADGPDTSAPEPGQEG